MSELIGKIKALDFSKIKITGDGKEIIREDGKSGIWKITMPDNLIQIVNGSNATADEFLRGVNVSGENQEKAKAEILGMGIAKVEEGEPLTFTDDKFVLRVYHGVTNEKILKMSKLANSGELNEQDRAEYQKMIAELIEPVLRGGNKEEKQPDFWVIEDCVATGDTIAGVLALLREKKLFGENKEINRVRIDVVVATVQGILVLKKFAKQNNLDLEINVGSLAFGLNENAYLVYTPEVTELDQFNGKGLTGEPKKLQVVGDMGNAAKVLPSQYNGYCPWNKERNDNWGNDDASEFGELIKTDKAVALFFANGGWLMKAIAEWMNVIDGYQKCVLCAKRINRAREVLVNYKH